MMVAAKGAPSLALTIVTLVGGAMAAGGANALNCYIDRDIDAQHAPHQKARHRHR